MDSTWSLLFTGMTLLRFHRQFDRSFKSSWKFQLRSNLKQAGSASKVMRCNLTLSKNVCAKFESARGFMNFSQRGKGICERQTLKLDFENLVNLFPKGKINRNSSQPHID